MTERRNGVHKRPESPATIYSTGNKGQDIVNKRFLYQSPIPQPDTNREIDIAIFAEHLLECANTSSQQFIGEKVLPQSTPIKITPFANHGTGLYFPEHRS